MSNKILSIFSVLFLIAVVGVISWHDMHPKTEDSKPKRMISLFAYHVDSGVTPDMIPDDNLPLTFPLGTFKYTPKGVMAWVQQDMPPTTFAQRQINLLIRFDSLPENPAETLEKAKSLADAWENQGNIVSSIILDYRPQNPDLVAYAKILKAFRDHFKMNYSIGIMANISWADAQRKTSLHELSTYTSLLIVPLPQPQLTPGLVSALTKFDRGFFLQLPAGALPEDIDMATLEKPSFLAGYVLTLDSHKPWPKKEEKVGLFPKF